MRGQTEVSSIKQFDLRCSEQQGGRQQRRSVEDKAGQGVPQLLSEDPRHEVRVPGRPSHPQEHCGPHTLTMERE